MLAPAKRTSAPRLSTFISACSFWSRSLRRRSKSTRCCQSAPVWLYNRRGSFWCGLPRKLMSIPDAGSTLRSFHLTKSAIAHLSVRYRFEGRSVKVEGELQPSHFELQVCDWLSGRGDLSRLLGLLRFD